MLPAGGTQVLQPHDGDPGGVLIAPTCTTCTFRTDSVCLTKFQVTEIACEILHVPPSLGVLGIN